MKKVRTISNIICLLLIVGLIAFLVIEWKSIPDVIPTHFQMNGVADSHGSKSSLIFMPILMIITFAIIAVGELFPESWNFPVKVTKENKERLIRIVGFMLAVIKVLAMCIFLAAELGMILGCINSWIMMSLIALIFLVIIVAVVECIKTR